MLLFRVCTCIFLCLIDRQVQNVSLKQAIEIIKGLYRFILLKPPSMDIIHDGVQTNEEGLSYLHLPIEIFKSFSIVFVPN